MSLTNTVLTINGGFTISKQLDINGNDIYVISYTQFWYISQTSYQEKNDAIKTKYDKITISSTDLPENIYTLIYTKIKSDYQNTTDI
jgi:hypothetical protein